MTVSVAVSVKVSVGTGDRPRSGRLRGIDIGGPEPPAAAVVMVKTGAGGDISKAVVANVEGLCGIGLGRACRDGVGIRGDDDVVQWADVDGERSGIGDSAVGAGDRPGASLGRSVDTGGPTAAGSGCDAKDGKGGDIAEGVVVCVESLGGICLCIAGGDGVGDLER